MRYRIFLQMQLTHFLSYMRPKMGGFSWTGSEHVLLNHEREVFVAHHAFPFLKQSTVPGQSRKLGSKGTAFFPILTALVRPSCLDRSLFRTVVCCRFDSHPFRSRRRLPQTISIASSHRPLSLRAAPCAPNKRQFPSTPYIERGVLRKPAPASRDHEPIPTDTATSTC